MCTDQIGDSILSGIISTGFQCALPRIPGLYTRLSHYSSWMKQIINAHPNVDMVNIDFRDFSMDHFNRNHFLALSRIVKLQIEIPEAHYLHQQNYRTLTTNELIDQIRQFRIKRVYRRN